MKKFISALVIAATLGMTGCASMNSQPVQIKQAMVVGVQNSTFTVNDPNLAGAAIGATAGGVIGHQFGKGNGKTAMTVLGVLGGAAVGSQVNANKVVQGWSVTLRSNDGEVVTFNTQTPLQVGQVVNYRNQGGRVTLY